jgi:hypothetical protein
MAVPREQEAQPVDGHELATALAEMIGHEPSVVRMWMSYHRGVASFWLLTTSTEASDERRLYGLSGDLFDRFPEAMFRLHLLNPRDYESFELELVLPQGAEEIALRAS